MGPTKLSTLVVAALAAAALGWLVISSWYVRMPVFPWLPSVTLAALAVFEGYAAINTRARVDPLLVARFVVLAKASALAGAIFAGFYAGLLLWLFIQQTRAANNDLPAAASGLVAAVLLVVAALWLERACRVPERPEDSDVPGEPAA
jgi:hypothetical protein